MRNAFSVSVTKLAEKNKKITLLSGDIGNRLFDNFRKKFKKRFYNCGIAEANMTGIASGLAIRGFHPITYTITPFNTLRCIEQIKIDICYPELPVIIVGTGAGLSYSNLGATHHSLDDIGMLRTIPNLVILAPSGPSEVHFALEEAIKQKKPTYIRIGKKGEPDICIEKKLFKIGKPTIIKKYNSEVCLLSSGNILGVALETHNMLLKRNIKASIYNIHTLKPFNKVMIKNLLSKYKLIVLLHEHSIVGGLTSIVAENIMNLNTNKNKFINIAAPDDFFCGLGSQKDARRKLGLEAKSIFLKIIKNIK